MSPEIEHLQEKVLAGRLLTVGASKAASVIDGFVGWLVGGAGGVLGLIVSNIGDISPHLPVSAVKCAATLFLIAAGLTVVEKYLASLVLGAAESSQEAADIGRRLAVEEVEINFQIVFKELEKATLPPMRWFAMRSVAKAEKGDFAAAGRNYARTTQVQGLFALAIAVMVVWSLSTIVCALGG